MPATGGRPVGALGDVDTFSFYGNKLLTSGEGGAVVTNNDEARPAHAHAPRTGHGPGPSL